jgi:hypothetical protein
MLTTFTQCFQMSFLRLLVQGALCGNLAAAKVQQVPRTPHDAANNHAPQLEGSWSPAATYLPPAPPLHVSLETEGKTCVGTQREILNR